VRPNDVNSSPYADQISQYAPTIFAQAGIPSQTASFLASGVSAILMLAFSIPATLLADKWGRRTSAIYGGVILSGTMLLIGSLYAANVVHSDGAARWVVIVSVFVFAIGYVSTWAIVGKIYASEIQPTRTRATTNSMATGGSFVSRIYVFTAFDGIVVARSLLISFINSLQIGSSRSQPRSSSRGPRTARTSSSARSRF